MSDLIMHRINTRLSDSAYNYINDEMKKRDSKFINNTIEQICAEHAEMKQRLFDEDALVEKIFRRFKTTLDVIRVRAGHADKNGQVNLELWNAYLLENPMALTILTDARIADPVRKAQDKVTGDIAKYKLLKDQKNKDDQEGNDQ